MLKMSLKDFVEEVKTEIICANELGEERAKEWEIKFLEVANSNKSKIAKKEKNGIVIYIRDESDVFGYADNYWTALEQKSLDEYWAKFY